MPRRGRRRSAQPATERAVRPGYMAALVLRKDAAPLRCYVGEVQDVDEHGVRLTLVDWFVGTPSGWDFFVPWESITAALVATSDHDLDRFRDAAADFQQRSEGLAH